jgi:hypothetical protein
MIETWNREGSQESIWATLAEKHSNVDMEPEEATSCTHRTLSGEIRTSTHPKNVYSQICLSTRNAGTTSEHILRECPIINSPT